MIRFRFVPAMLAPAATVEVGCAVRSLIALYEGWAALSDNLRTLVGQVNGLDRLPRFSTGRTAERSPTETSR